MTAITKFDPHYVVIDTANLFARCILAQGQDQKFAMATASGRATGHVYRLVRSLLSLRSTFPKAKFVFALEGGGKKLRKKIHSEYKGHRKHREGYQELFDDCNSILSTLMCRTIISDAGEADDSIASFVALKQEKNTLILSNDKDMWALIKYPHVRVYNQNAVIGEEHVQTNFGCSPRAIPLYKSLFGDSSDNIPKVARLMPDHTQEFFNKEHRKYSPSAFFRWVEGSNMVENLKERIYSSKDQIRTMYRVAKLAEDLPLKVSQQPGNYKQLHALLNSLECYSLLPHIEKLTGLTEKYHGQYSRRMRSQGC